MTVCSGALGRLNLETPFSEFLQHLVYGSIPSLFCYTESIPILPLRM